MLGTATTVIGAGTPGLARRWKVAAAIIGLSALKFALVIDPPAGAGAVWIGRAFALNVLDILLIYVAWRVAERYPVGRAQPVSHLAPHVAAALVYSAVSVLISDGFSPAIDADGSDRTMPTRAVANVVAYALWAAAVHGIEYFRRYRASSNAERLLQIELADLARQRAEAQSRALRAQLNPQVLGTTLDSVVSLVRTDPAAAERTLVEMGDMLRDAISRRRGHEATLGEDIEAAAPYLAVQRARFGERFSPRWDIDEQARDALVPYMILQTMIEAVVSGTHTDRDAPNVGVGASRERRNGDHLQLEVSAVSASPVEGTSRIEDVQANLSGARALLHEMYGESARLDVKADPDGVVIVSLVLPWRDEDEAVDATSDLPPGTLPARDHSSPRVFLTMWFAAIFGIASTTAFRTPLRSGLRAPLHGAITEGVLVAAISTGMVYVAIRLARSTSDRTTWIRHLLAAGGFVVAQGASRPIVFWVIGAPYLMPTMDEVLGEGFPAVLQYGIIAAIVHAVEYGRRYQRSEASALKLRAQTAEAGRRRAEAELRALKLELNPHFLGNALATASSLLRVDPTAAERLLGQLGETLRTAVARAGTQEVTLAEEIEGLAPFIDIERARFGDQLVVVWEVDAEARAARVPHMILQPLIENAVKHGISPRDGRGHIIVAARRAGEQLHLSVRDDGIGPSAPRGEASRKRAGVGLTNTRARLKELYGTDASVDLLAAPEGGTIVRLILPWH